MPLRSARKAPSPDHTTTALHRPGMATWLVALGASALTGCQAAFFGGLNVAAGRPGDIVQQTVEFEPQERLSLDIYKPRGVLNAPIVVFFYGGSWMSGKRQWYRWVGQALAQQGWVVVIPDYRKWPKVRLDGFMQDAAHAVAWTYAHAGQYGGDPHELFLMGHSAGAHIGALLATDAHWLAGVNMQPRQLAGFVGLAGPYDFLPLTHANFIDMFGSTTDAQRRSQPVNFVDGNEPPMLLLQGTGDSVVGVKNAKSLANAMHREDESAQMTLYPDIGHAAILLALSPSFSKKAPVREDVAQFIQTQVAIRRGASVQQP
jgi:acetyl esterase/lipase